MAALERLVIHEEHRERIAELLEPVYREQDWWQKLVVILDAKLDYIRDPIDQITTLHEIARAPRGARRRDRSRARRRSRGRGGSTSPTTRA